MKLSSLHQVFMHSSKSSEEFEKAAFQRTSGAGSGNPLCYVGGL